MQLFVGVKAAILHEGKVLLLRESTAYLDGAEAGKWDLPGGRIEKEETLDAALAREVGEETGLRVLRGDLLGAYDGFPVIRGEKCHVVRLYFLCETASPQVTLSGDHDQHQWIDPHVIPSEIELMDDLADVLAQAATRI
jgi:8-oxo-dGTP diphosphatase